MSLLSQVSYTKEHRRPHKIRWLKKERRHMSVITSLTIQDGTTAHITAQVLDQYGNIMTGSVPVITDPGPASSFSADPGTTGAGVVAAVQPGSDTATATFGVIAAFLPIIVQQAPSVPTTIQFTSP